MGNRWALEMVHRQISFSIASRVLGAETSSMKHITTRARERLEPFTKDSAPATLASQKKRSEKDIGTTPIARTTPLSQPFISC